MKTTPPAAGKNAAATTSHPDIHVRSVRPSGRPQRNLPHKRKYEVAYLTRNGQIAEIARMAPALRQFEDAFAVLAHGSILQTANGPMAVEDLWPGDQVRLADGTMDKLLWRGTIVIHPDDPAGTPGNGTLTRITADALGPHRPAPDLIVGSSARMLHRATGIRTLTGSTAAFVPVRDFVDGNNFVELRPATSVNVYQLGFAGHRQLLVNGIEIESLHPGTAFNLGLRGDILAEYMSLFPHKSSIEDFGMMQHPRLQLRDLDLFSGV